jgi:acetyltransferase
MGGFTGPIQLVNPRYSEIEGVTAVKRIADLPDTPDVVVIAAPPAEVPSLIAARRHQRHPCRDCHHRGPRHGPGSLSDAASRAARASGLRLIGPNCLGVLVPPVKLNVSFAARMPQSGDLALISQSGAIAAGLVEWAAKRSVGFSAVISLGDQIDVDFRRSARLFRRRPRTESHSALHRVGQGRP